MRESGKSSLGLAGSLLIAHPSLLDPNFRRSILYISSSNPEDGSLGFVLNRPTDRTVGDFLAGKELGLLEDLPVFIGGPVGQDQLTFASFEWKEDKQLIVCRTHLLIPEVLDLTGDDSTSVRAFVGYAGWSNGQLEEEIEQKAWLVQKPDRDILDIEKCKALWQTILREQGPWFKLLAAAPDDPSQN